MQDLLCDLGYEEKQTERVFARGDVKIPFEDIAGHGVGSFLDKARHKGWVTDDEARQKMGKVSEVLDPTNVRAP